jgi:hypothetical protein
VDLMPVYQELSKGQAGPFWDAHPDYVRPDVAETARQDALWAAEHDRADIMFLAASVAATVYLRLGDRNSALINRLDALQALFMLTEEQAGYDDVRNQALQLHEMAAQIPFQRVMFRSLVLAADCSWFAAEAGAETAGAETAGTETAKETRLVRTLEDVLGALGAAGPVVDDPANRTWVERLASILSVSAQAAMSRFWPNRQTELDGLLRQLAVAADVLPVDLPFEAEGPGKAAGVAVVLEQLESRYR